ncbi:glycoside hydrolase 43 family protein [Phocaeicola plebeius]|jgi:beta-xylosidase|uniref:Glycoside hydrolase n=1 Tax=Phocaeicola plebeius TaxID=310297 RepID=A0A3E4WAS2_9BACT|nr:glycoside hydrolase 43 family protein [Phocaeicola plebeius]HBV18926.1 glycoside hydrolase [Bacteroides sp.]MBD9353859.1 glycosyl hydrolase 43 family protein [Phocaeicola plebeius]RGM39274.1 glycoside hydrolase [Phocaeicola plebeius]RGQ71243.1 glycoside hydrolase [Phocaeicola plebeius]RGQ90619.1 glycoside hydrolase [Phocaeicola plebeius]
MKGLFFILSLSVCSLFHPAMAQYRSEVWVSDEGNGMYRNPVLHADYSDPDVCAVGEDYFLTASSFNCTPGLPILHSKDLVNWKIVNYALKKVEPVEYYNEARHGKGVWAPSIRFHEGVFYIYWGDPDFGIFMVKTRDPYGEWDKPVLVKAGKGMIDPCPLWDDDGRVYLAHAWAGSRAKFNSVLTVCEMNKEGTAVISDPVLVFDGNDGVNHTIEGAKFYKRNGFYYLFAPAGGVVSGWQLVMRSKDVYGPYEARIVMAQGKTDINGPHQGGWVDTPAGESWFLHFQDKGAYGRVLHLNPMKWINDWPVIGVDKDGDGCGDPVSRYRKPKTGKTYPIETPVESDEFDTRKLGLQWEWHANYQDVFGFTTNMGYVRIYGHELSPHFKNFWEVPNLLMQKFPAEEFTATAKLKVSAKDDGQLSGLIIMGWDYSWIGVEKQGEKFLLKQAVCKDAEQGNLEQVSTLAVLEPSRKFEAGLFPNYEREIYIRVHVDKGAYCRFSYSLDGKKFTEAGTLFKARQGKWIGAKVGMFSVTPHGKERGWLDVDWFRVEK